MMKWIMRLRSFRLSLLICGEISALGVGNQNFVCLQVVRRCHLFSHLQSPHCFTAVLTSCLLWYAKCVWTSSQSTLASSVKTVLCLSNKSLFLDNLIFEPAFLASVRLVCAGAPHSFAGV